MRIAVVGGTGDFGLALARRLVDAGDYVVIGSRDAERARAKAAEAGAAAGASNADAVGGVDLVVLAVKADSRCVAWSVTVVNQESIHDHQAIAQVCGRR